MRWHPFVYTIVLIAAFALSMVLIDRILACIPARSEEIDMPSLTETEETHTEVSLDQTEAYTQSSVTDNGSTDYGALEQYDWIIVFGGLLLAFFICMGSAWAYAAACRARADDYRAYINADERVRARLLAEANRLIEKEVYPTAQVAQKAVGGVCAAGDLRNVIERTPGLSNSSVAKLLRQIERCESRIIQAQKKRNAFVAEHNATIHSFPFCMIAERRGFADQTGYDAAWDGKDLVTDDLLADAL